MKVIFCSFCRTKQDRVFGLTSDPDAYCICGECLKKFVDMPGKRLVEPCCFCGSTVSGHVEPSSGAIICQECVRKFYDQSQKEPEQTVTNEIEEIIIDWPVYFDAAMDLIQVKVKLQDASVWQANFTTPARIPWEMEKGKRSGDWAHGTYFWHADLLFVEELTEELINKAIRHLWENKFLEKAFRKLE